MKKNLVNLFVSTASALVLSESITAQIAVPAAINYQGVLVDSNGSRLPDGNTNVIFSVWDSPQSGNLVWGPVTNPVAVVRGTFNTLVGGLDSTTPSPRDFAAALLAQAQAPNSPAFLQITLGDTSAQPRQQILSAPFAFVANTANSANTALTAKSADHAATADTSAFATNAGSATNALHATQADTATSAATAQNSKTLNGFGWESVFFGGAPQINGMNGVLLRDGSVGLSKLASKVLSSDAFGQYHFGSGGFLGPNQGGSIELGDTTAGNTPFIDFHLGGKAFQDFNVRLINDRDGGLSLKGSLFCTGDVKIDGSFFSRGLLILSDRRAKQGFTEIKPASVLEKLVSLPISQWMYQSDDSGDRHIGPMAQDFQQAFSLSADDTHISVVDLCGISFAAIQGLNQKLEHQLALSRTENTELKERLSRLEEVVKSLARQ
jgi:hypothetical protein